MSKKPPTRGDEVVSWVAGYCRVPAGMRKGDRVYLTPEQRQTIAEIYDAPDAPIPVPVTGELAAYLALLHTCGIEHVAEPPPLTVDIFTLLAACGPELRAVLTREGSTITCAALGKSFSGRAA